MTMKTGKTVAVVMAAGGRGRRMGADLPKQFILLAGKPLFLHALQAFLEHPAIGVIVLGTPAEFMEKTADLVRQFYPSSSILEKVRIFEGGARRQDTVAKGVRLLSDFPDILGVMVHDAARPFLSRPVLDRSVEALQEGKAFGVGIPVSDTLWEKDGESEETILSGIIQREKIMRAQTPQGSPVDMFLNALDQAEKTGDPDFTDEASLLLWAGFSVHIVMGEESNRKITTPADLTWAEQWIEIRKRNEWMEKERPEERNSRRGWPRIGQGIDVHPFEEGRELWLGGVKIPHSRGLAGHSDADAVIHALCDALLGAVGEGDIGRHFPPSDERYRGKNSRYFLEEIVVLLSKKGYLPHQVDLTIVTERPKISPYAGKMQEVLSRILGIAPGDVSIKATTSEKLGFTGREEGLMAMAVATVIPSSEGSGT